MNDDGSLGGAFWAKMVGAIVVIGIAAMIFFIVLGSVWETWGFLGFLVVTFGVFLLIAYISDKRKQREEW